VCKVPFYILLAQISYTKIALPKGKATLDKPWCEKTLQVFFIGE
jgi:hypothetical protein